MLSSNQAGTGQTTLYLLHFLGSSQHEWRRVSAILAPSFRCIAIDLPGFGDSAHIDGYTVEQMRDSIADYVRADAPGDWLLVGHSMGAKVAAAVARQAADGDAALRGLKGLVMMAGSPPSPEPISDQRRADMKRWFTGDATESRSQALTFIENNRAYTIDPSAKAQAVEDVLRMNRAAWLAWLNAGSREDWSQRVGVLTFPTLILAGQEDPDLGMKAQRELMLPHFSQAELKTIAGAKHLLPLESPDTIASLISKHANSVTGNANHSSDHYRALIESDRVSGKTREALLEREALEVNNYVPAILTFEELSILRTVVASMLPQTGSHRIDIAQYLDRDLQGPGDGWRFAKLLEDNVAYRSGLQTLDLFSQEKYGRSFVDLNEADQKEALSRALDGKLNIAQPADSLLTSEQVKLWLLDLKAAAVRAYMSHPSTLAAIGYSGIADGGDSGTMQGFVQIGPGETESWEPTPKVSSR